MKSNYGARLKESLDLKLNPSGMKQYPPGPCNRYQIEDSHFSFFFITSSWRILRYFYLCEKNLRKKIVTKIYKRLMLKCLKIFLSYYYYKFCTNLSKITWKPLKDHVKFIFFLIIITIEQLRWQNSLQRCLNKILGAENGLLDLEKRKEL